MEIGPSYVAKAAFRGQTLAEVLKVHLGYFETERI